MWPGRDEALAPRPPPAVELVPLDDSELATPAAPIAVVEGDNADVLGFLAEHRGPCAQLVFLDPPYNTGRAFTYDDRHGDAWLSMIAPRLVLARALLAPDGLLVATIDEREVHHLRMLLDEVFGASAFVACCAWQKAYVSNMTARHISHTHDHVIVYAADPERAKVGRLDRTPKQLAAFKNPDDDPRGPWKAENLSAGRPYAAGRFAITTPAGREVRPPPGRYWRCNRERYEGWLDDGRIWFGMDGSGRPMLKKFLSEVRPGLTPSTWWPHGEVGSNKEATLELKRLLGGRALFDTPKPVRLLRRILRLFCPPDGLVIDPFAGSGTTAHAILAENAERGTSRSCVCVELDTVHPTPGVGSLAALCRERVQRAHEALGHTGRSSRAWRAIPAGSELTPEGHAAATALRAGASLWGPLG